jgi:hypothetical protein
MSLSYIRDHSSSKRRVAVSGLDTRALRDEERIALDEFQWKSTVEGNKPGWYKLCDQGDVPKDNMIGLSGQVALDCGEGVGG